MHFCMELHILFKYSAKALPQQLDTPAQRKIRRIQRATGSGPKRKINPLIKHKQKCRGEADELIRVQRARVQEQHDPEEAPQSLRRVQLASVKIQAGFRMHLELGPETIPQPSTLPLV